MAVWIMNNKKLGGWLKAAGLKKLALAPGFAFGNDLFEDAKAEVVRQHPEETDPDSRAAYRLLARNRPKTPPAAMVYRPDTPKWLRVVFGVLVLGLLSVLAARSQTVVFKDEGVVRVRRAGGQVGVDFVGAGVSCSTSVAGITTCTITGSGSSTFLLLTDTPGSYAGSGGLCVAVKSTVDGLEFISCGGGGGSQHQIDGVNLTSNDPINFLDTSVFDWTNPAAGNLSLAIKAASLADSLMASSYSGVGGCVNQFARTLNDDAAPTCATVDLTADVTSTLPVGSGGTGTAVAFTLGSVVFAGASGVYTQDNANFFWHNTNNRLGIGTAAPDNKLSIVGTPNALADLAVEQGYHLKIQNINDLDGQGVGISFGMSSTDDQQTGAIVSKRTGGNGQGTLQFYTKQSTVSGVAPVLALTLDQSGDALFTGAITEAGNAIPNETQSPNAAGDVEGNYSAGLTIKAGSVASAELATANKSFSRGWTILDPTTADTNFGQLDFPTAITITEVRCSTNGTATPTVTIQLDERAEATPNTAGTNVMTSSLVCDTNTEKTSTFTNAGIAGDVPLNLQITAIGGTPTVVRISVQYTVD